MIFELTTGPPNTVYTWAPRLATPLTIDRCGVVIYASITAQYYYDSASQQFAGVGLLPPSAEPPPSIGRTCWVEYPRGTDTWYRSTVRAQTLATLLIDPISAIAEKTLTPINIKVVKYWTD